MKIVLKNQSCYRDDDLRALVKECVKQSGAEVNVLILTVKNQRSNGRVNGRASCRTGCRKWFQAVMKLYPKKPDQLDLDRFKKTIIHEAMHLAGATHGTMTTEQYYCTFELPEWAKPFELRAKEAEPKEERLAASTDELEHARAMLAKANTRLKRSTTIAKKWQRRVNRLESKL